MKKFKFVRGAVLLALAAPFALNANGLSFALAKPKIREAVTGSLEPYEAAFLEMMSKVLSGSVKLEISSEMTNHSKTFELGDDYYIYVSIDMSEPETVYSFSLSRYGPSVGSCTFEFFNDHSVKEGSCDLYGKPSERAQTVFYDDQMNWRKVDYYKDPTVKDLKEIYGSNFEPPTLDVKVGVIDSGVDYNHPALARSLPRYRDKNNLLRVSGWDFEDNDAEAFDLAQDAIASHGTAVAELVTRINPSAEIIPIRTPSSGSLYESIAYARNAGARILNLSFEIVETFEPSERARVEADLERAMREFRDVLFVVAAGNETKNLDENRIVPQTLLLPNMIVVGSVDIDGRLTANEIWGSNYSRRIVHVAALGNSIEVAIPGGTFEISGGTSFAAPKVAGVVSLYKKERPKASPEDLIRLLRDNLLNLKNLEEQTLFAGVPRLLSFELRLQQP